MRFMSVRLRFRSKVGWRRKLYSTCPTGDNSHARLQPSAHVPAHCVGEFVPRVLVALKLDIACTLAQLSFIIRHTRWRIELVARARKMQHARLRRLVCRARLPIAGQAPTDANDAAQNVCVREREAIVERAGLRETEQEEVMRINDAFINQCGDQI